jgi:hypothetical protein
VNGEPPEVGSEGEPAKAAPESLAEMRAGLGCISVPIGIIAAWMFWIVNTCLDGHGVFDLVVGLLLDELIGAIALFAMANLVWAIFAPRWLERLLGSVYAHLAHAIAWFWIIVVSAVLIGSVAGLLAQFGLIR